MNYWHFCISYRYNDVKCGAVDVTVPRPGLTHGYLLQLQGCTVDCLTVEMFTLQGFRLLISCKHILYCCEDKCTVYSTAGQKYITLCTATRMNCKCNKENT
jgi:hypothetical protein